MFGKVWEESLISCEGEGVCGGCDFALLHYLGKIKDFDANGRVLGGVEGVGEVFYDYG